MKAFELIFQKKQAKTINRTLLLNVNQSQEFCSNIIKTSKYNIINFFPKCLFLQFMRVANFYFLATAVVQSISIISPLEPFSAIAPLVFVLVVSLIREAIDDIKRYKNDNKTNFQKATIYNENSECANALWKDLAVGNFVKVMNGEIFPADLLLLTSSDEMGVCYVETSNLDGERNLKCKQSIETIKKELESMSVRQLQGKIIYENPNNHIHHFKGMCYLNKETEPLFLNNDQVLLRGTSLKNTDWIIGVVIYTGHDSKIKKNQGVVRHKTTHIERRLNKMAVWILVLQAIICIILAIFSAAFTASHNSYYGGDLDCEYIFYEQNKADSWSPDLTGLVSYFSFFLLLNTMIPISLIISLEVIKVIQSAMIEFDQDMYYEEYKIGCKVLNTMIHEELGKIEYIFADKTGTLTSNNMEFKRCSINWVEFSMENLVEMTQTQLKLDQYLNSNFIHKEKIQNFYDFWFALSLCHDVLVDKSFENKHSYQGSSPDEITLVNVAKTMNFEFKKRSMNQISMELFLENMTFDLLAKLDFTSERKRMSVIVRHPQTHQIIVFCKGADSVIMPRITKNTDSNDLLKAKEHLKMFSKEGLRTLCIAKSEIDNYVFDEWYNKYQTVLKRKNASKNPEEDKIVEMEIMKIEEEIERDLHLLGITAVEDKLQDGVPEIIQNLHEADIKIWMLTGDKLETAENIGYLCNLITKETKVFKIQSTDIPNLILNFEKIHARINEYQNGKLLKKCTTNKEEENLMIPVERFPIDTQNNGPYVQPVELPNDIPNNTSNKPSFMDAPVERLPIDSPNGSFSKPFSHQVSINKYHHNMSGGAAAIFPESFKIQVKSFAMVIEGDVISAIFSNPKFVQHFLKIIPVCRTVICCRSTPNQKAEIVKFMKNSLQKVTLAIGDGGNDVNMIQTADIGVGIYGKEGNQAASSSDYSFCQFKYLWNLLFVHGRWSYLRSAFFVKFFFYKNIFFTFQQCWFAIYSGFSAQTFWEDGYLLMFNSIVTGFAPACYALWEQDINPKDNAKIRNSMPKIYNIFKQKELFSYANFIFWFVKGLIQSLIIYFITFYCANASAIVEEGFVGDLWVMSIIAYSSTFAVIMIELTIETSNFTILVHIFYWLLAVIIYFPLFVFIYDKFESPLQYYAIDMFTNSTFWFVMLLTMAIFGGFKYVLYVLKRFYRPDEIDILQYDRYFRAQEEKHQKKNGQKNDVIQKKHSKNPSQVVQREFEMDNLSKDGGENVAYEAVSSDKRNVLNYNFTNNLKIQDK